MSSTHKNELPILAEYERRVKLAVTSLAPDVINDFDVKHPIESHIKWMYSQGFSLRDAIRYTCLMDQTLDEDAACNELSSIYKKYKD